MIILDTNVVAETMKPAPSVRAIAWLRMQEKGTVFLTTITVGELLWGVEALPIGKRRASISEVVERRILDFADQTLPFDEQAARMFPKVLAALAGRNLGSSTPDAMIASIALSRGATLAAKNAKYFEHTGVELVNPWTD